VEKKDKQEPIQETGDRRQETHLSPVPCLLSPGFGLFAVIPSFVLVGPLAIVAALFPGVFARMAVGMKRWRAFLVVASINSTLAITYYFTQKYLPSSRWFGL